MPGMCLDVKRMLYLRQFSTSLRTKTLLFGSREVCLLTISTTAWLSEKKTMQWLRMIAPQISVAKTIGKNSSMVTGNPSSKYEHRRASALLRNIQNIRKKTYRFRNLQKWTDFNKKQLTFLKMCVTSLLCGPRADLWPFYGFLCKRFSLYIKVYKGWALQRSGSTDLDRRKMARNSLQLLQSPPNFS